MELFIINHFRIITVPSGASDTQIIEEAQRFFPNDFSSSKSWRVKKSSEPPHLTMEINLPESCPGGYNCDRCDDPIFDDIRFHNPEEEEDYCPDCCDEKEKKHFLKLSARPKIAKDLKRDFCFLSTDKKQKQKQKELSYISSEEQAIDRLRTLLSYLGRDGNAKNLILAEDSDNCFAIKKIKPMLSDEKKTLKVVRELMQTYFSKCTSSEFCDFRKEVLKCETLEDLENLKNKKKRKINGTD